MHSLGCCCAGVAGLFKLVPNLGIFAISVPATQKVGCTADLPCCRYKNTRFVQFGS